MLLSTFTLLRNRVKRVASYLFHNLTLTFGCTKAEEVFHGNNIGGLYVFRENLFPYNGFVRDRKSLLENIPFYRHVSNWEDAELLVLSI